MTDTIRSIIQKTFLVISIARRISFSLLLLLFTSTTAFSGSATWRLDPPGNFWPEPTNWTPTTVPNGPEDTATFGASNTTALLEFSSIEVNGILFNAGASAFTITCDSGSSLDQFLTISGAGVTNNSGLMQNFVSVYNSNTGAALPIQFRNSATAGELTAYTSYGSDDCGTSGATEFFDFSNAGSATFTGNGNNFSCGGKSGGSTKFFDNATAANATLIANTGAGDGGAILFSGDSDGGTARVEVFGNGNLDISSHNAPGVTIGSIEGDGIVTLGGNNLTMSSNDHNVIFSGVIQDGGAGGSLTKMGRKRLTLASASTYSGGTTVGGGSLFVRNRTGSATGTGPVQVDAGKLGGGGIIAGPVTVGTASGSGSIADLSPGNKGVQPGTLTILSTLTFHSHGNYRFELDGDDATADQVIANGVTMRARANFFVTDLGAGILRNAELYDQGGGTWSATDRLVIKRSGHTATLLPDGTLLVAGGNSGPGPSAELYDPASATWTATGSLITARSGHTATLLPNGKVLVAGGNLGFGPTASAEFYDPASGIWTATGDMTSARYFHTATLLSSGKVLVVGSPGVATAELYDPASGTWTLTSRPITSRWAHTAKLLSDGKVLVAGGSTGIGLPTDLAELYDPATGTWSATGHLRDARQVHAAALLTDGKVLVAGGQGTGINELTSAEVYDPASGTWIATGSLATPRSYFTATLLPDGKVLAAGGNNGIHFTEASVELYDPASGNWTVTGSLDPGRYYHTASLLPDGQVLVAGGVGFGLPIGTVFIVIDNTSAAPISGTFANLPDGSTISVGGKNYEVSYLGGDGNDLTLTVVQ